MGVSNQLSERTMGHHLGLGDSRDSVAGMAGGGFLNHALGKVHALGEEHAQLIAFNHLVSS